MKTILNKTLTSILLLFLSILLLTSCKKNTAEPDEILQVQDTTQAERDKYQEKIKITLCLDSVTGSAEGKALYEGLMRVKDELGDYYEVSISEMGSDPLTWDKYIYQAADDYADIIIGIGSKNKDYFETIPTEYPDTYFILMDQVIDYTEADLSNVLSVIFDEHHSGFLAGSAAALYIPVEEDSQIGDGSRAEKNRIGFIGAGEENEKSNFLIGFIEGAKYVDPQIEVLTGFIDGTKEDRSAEAIVNAQIEKGAGVIFTSAGESDDIILERCLSAGIQGINCVYGHAEEQMALERESVLLTSAVKYYDEGIFSLLNAYCRDEKSLGFGKTEYLNLEKDAVGIVRSDSLLTKLGEEKMEQLVSIQNKIKGKEIFVPKASELTEDEVKEYIPY